MPSAVLNWLFGSGLGDRRIRRIGGMIFDKVKQSMPMCPFVHQNSHKVLLCEYT
jgi:hypothetical protein